MLLAAARRRAEPVAVDRTWWSAAGAHGGHLAALGLTTARERVVAELGTDRPVRSLTTQFLAVVDDRPFTLEAAVAPAGRSAAAATFIGARDGAALLLGSALFGAPRPGPVEIGHPAPAVPGPADSEPVALRDELAPFARRLEIRAATPARPLATGGDLAELVAWVRFRDDRPLDAAAVTVLADSLPPALYARWTEPVPAPTADLAVHFTDALDTAPAAGWALARMHTVHAGSGWDIDDCSIWDDGGRLLAVARQTRRILASGRTA